MDSPDFYMASSEGYDMQEPRRCWQKCRLETSHRNDLMLITIEPPLIGQKYGLGAIDIHDVVIAPRHRGVSLFPVAKWPVYVHVARLLVPLPNVGTILRSDDLEEIAWAEIYPSEEDARIRRV